MIKARTKLSYTFGAFRLDVTERLLFHENNLVSLTPKAFDTLLALVQHNRHVLTTEELMAQVWPDSFVEGNNLAQNISTLRKVLGAGGAKFIETVPKRGYRFVADVKEIRDEVGTHASGMQHSGGVRTHTGQLISNLTLDRPPETMYAR